jgi:hypothetical protein
MYESRGYMAAQRIARLHTHMLVEQPRVTYGAVHLDTAYFVHEISHLQKKRELNFL